MAQEKKEVEDERENISVKGVQKHLYERMKALARETGRTIGEVTTKLTSWHLVQQRKQGRWVRNS